LNIVGPGRSSLSIFVYLREHIEATSAVSGVRPGITGWAQINQGI